MTVVVDTGAYKIGVGPSLQEMPPCYQRSETQPLKYIGIGASL